MKTIKLIIVLTLVFSSQTWGAEQPKVSGFIQPAPVLTPTPDMEGVWHWNKAGIQFKDYDKILLEDIEIFIAPDSEYKGINGDQMKMLADSMRMAMIESLEPEYPVVTKPGPGVMVGRIAITNVHLGKPEHRIGQYTPIGLVFGGIQKLAGKSRNLTLKDAMVEAEMFDSETAERIAVRVDVRPLRSLDEEPEEMTWEIIQEALKVYGKRFRERADDVRNQ